MVDSPPPDAQPVDDSITPGEMQDIENLIVNLKSFIDSKPHPEQYKPIDRPSLITSMCLLLDWEETGYVTKEAFRPVAAMLGLATTSDEEWEDTYTEFCGDFLFKPHKGVETT